MNITPDLEKRRKFYTSNGWMTREGTKAEIIFWKANFKPHPDTFANDTKAMEVAGVV